MQELNTCTISDLRVRTHRTSAFPNVPVTFSLSQMSSLTAFRTDVMGTPSSWQSFSACMLISTLWVIRTAAGVVLIFGRWEGLMWIVLLCAVLEVSVDWAGFYSSWSWHIWHKFKKIMDLIFFIQILDQETKIAKHELRKDLSRLLSYLIYIM